MRARSRFDAFHAVADPTRRRLLDTLARSHQTVTSLARPFRVSRPAISQHLGVLRKAGLVRASRQGRQRFYHLRPERLREVYDWVAHYERFWNERLAALGKLLEEMD